MVVDAVVASHDVSAGRIDGNDVRVARVNIDPARRDSVLAEYAKYVEAVQQFSGVLAWELCTETDADDVIWILAKSAGESAYEHHMSLPETQAVVPVLLDALVGEPTIRELTPQFSVSRQAGVS